MKNPFTTVFKEDGKCTFRSLCVSIVLILLFGCTPQPGFHFSRSRGSLAHQGHARDEPIAKLTTNDMLVGRIPFAAADSEKDTTFVPPINLLHASQIANLQTREAKKSLSAQQVKVVQLHKAFRKKGIGKSASEHAVHNLSWLSFGLSMAGLVLLIITLSASAPLLPFALSFLSFLAAILTSRYAISRIKKTHEQFSGKGLARGGFIISLIMLLLYVAFILYVLAFAGAF